MFDAVDAKDVPSSGFDLLAGYSNGNYQSYLPLKQRFPHVTVVSIDTQNKPGSAQVCDIENGDVRPDEAPAWFDASLRAGIVRPTLYYSASLHEEIKGYMGERKYDAWIGDYGPSECPVKSDAQVTVVAWQKQEQGPHGENIDVSDVFDPYWPLAEDDMFTDQDRAQMNHVFNFLHSLDQVAQQLGYQSYADLVSKTAPKALNK